MSQSSGEPNAAREVEQRHLQESIEAMLKMETAMAAAIQAAKKKKAASSTQNAAKGESTGEPDSKTK